MKWVFPDETVPYSQHNVSVCGATPISGNISWAAAVKFRLFNQQIIFFQSCAAVLNCSAEFRENSHGTACMDWKLMASRLSNFLFNQDNRKLWWFRVGTGWSQFPAQVQHPQIYPAQGGLLPVLLIKIAPLWRWTLTIRAQPSIIYSVIALIWLLLSLLWDMQSGRPTIVQGPWLYRMAQGWFCLIQTEINTSVSLETATKSGLSYFLILVV